MSSGTAPTGAPRPPAGEEFVYRLAELRDVAALVRLYRSLTPEARRFHHPYPFDPFRLTVLFLWMVGTRRWVRWLLRTVPNLTFSVFVASPKGQRRPVAYATIRFVARPGEPVWGRFGFLVQEAYRGRGVGSALAADMYRRCLALGVRRGGGTVLGDNLASRTIVERYGFHLIHAREPDRRAPGTETLEGVEDLEEVLKRVEAFQASLSAGKAPPAPRAPADPAVR